MWPFAPKPSGLLPDIVRQPVDKAFDLLVKQFTDHRLGLCLVGGGSKGRWQAGFLARMAEIGLLGQVQVIAGTSVGGLNSLLAAKYRDSFQAAVDVWRGIRGNADVYLGSLPTSAWGLFTALISGKLTGKSILDVRPLVDLVNKHFKNWSTELPVYVVTCERVRGMKIVLSTELFDSCVDMALSTCAVPGAFPAYKDLYMDGGCSSNAPVLELEEIGKADKIIVLYCDPDQANIQKSAGAPSVLGNILAAVNTLFAVQEERTFKEIELVAELRKAQGLPAVDYAHFYPSTDTGELLIFDKVELLQKGYDDAVAYLTPEKLAGFVEG